MTLPRPRAAPPERPAGGGVAATDARRAAGLLAGIGVLAAVCLLSVAVGTRNISPATVWDAFFHFTGTEDHTIVRDLRVPRTVLGLLTGMALGVSGALIQAVTRNPLADTQILGVNSGAALLVVFAIGVLGLTGIWSYVWFAFAGVAGAMVLVYALGSAGRGGATVEGRERLRLLNASLITDVRDAADGLKVSVEHLPTGRHETLDADLLIYATGYRPLDVGVLLGEAAKLCVRDEEDAIRVGRDHRVEVLPKVTAGIYLQGATEHSHGLGSTLLSTTAIRAGEIRDSLLARLGEPVRATRART